MSYLERLTGDMKAAMKARAPERVLVLRMLINGIKEQQSKLGRDDLEEDEELSVLQKAVKTRRDSVAQADKVGRRDVAEREQAEIAIVQAYLPEMMPPRSWRRRSGSWPGKSATGARRTPVASCGSG